MKRLHLNILLLLSVISMGALMQSCDNDFYDDPDARWYLSGTWQCIQYPDETLTFYTSGSGEWDDNYSGDYLPFNYYCDGNRLWFEWFPANGPSYTENWHHLRHQRQCNADHLSPTCRLRSHHALLQPHILDKFNSLSYRRQAVNATECLQPRKKQENGKT